MSVKNRRFKVAKRRVWVPPFCTQQSVSVTSQARPEHIVKVLKYLISKPGKDWTKKAAAQRTQIWSEKVILLDKYSQNNQTKHATSTFWSQLTCSVRFSFKREKADYVIKLFFFKSSCPLSSVHQKKDISVLAWKWWIPKFVAAARAEKTAKRDRSTTGVKQAASPSPVHVFRVGEIPGPGKEVGSKEVDDAFRTKELGAEDVSLNTVIMVKIKCQQFPLSTNIRNMFPVSTEA